MQLMLLLIQMEEYNRLIIVVLEIVISHSVATYPIRQRIHNFHDQIACLKSKLIFNNYFRNNYLKYLILLYIIKFILV